MERPDPVVALVQAHVVLLESIGQQPDHAIRSGAGHAPIGE